MSRVGQGRSQGSPEWEHERVPAVAVPNSTSLQQTGPRGSLAPELLLHRGRAVFMFEIHYMKSTVSWFHSGSVSEARCLGQLSGSSKIQGLWGRSSQGHPQPRNIASDAGSQTSQQCFPCFYKFEFLSSQQSKSSYLRSSKRQYFQSLLFRRAFALLAFGLVYQASVVEIFTLLGLVQTLKKRRPVGTQEGALLPRNPGGRRREAGIPPGGERFGSVFLFTKNMERQGPCSVCALGGFQSPCGYPDL